MPGRATDRGEMGEMGCEEEELEGWVRGGRVDCLRFELEPGGRQVAMR